MLSLQPDDLLGKRGGEQRGCCWEGLCPKLTAGPGYFLPGRNVVVTAMFCPGSPVEAPACSLERSWQQAVA